jgi:hypothetical protein
MDIKVVSEHKIMIHNHNIDVFILPYKENEPYEVIECNMICKLHSKYAPYRTSTKTILKINKQLSNKYGIKVEYFKFYYKAITIDGRFVRYVNEIKAVMPQEYYAKWLIKQRDKTIDQILCK